MGSIQLSSIDDPRLTPPRRYVWQDDALCAEIGMELFFPDKGGSTREAKSVCDKCEVALKCLKFALDAEGDDGHRHGIFGAHSERERRKIQKLMKDDPSMTLEEASNAVKSFRRKKGRAKIITDSIKPSHELQAI